uniref:Uncharacterized protein n=1 Tax=Brassica campestris TaxID=3711 RepID=A0A3P5YJ47_BRACM|nr:unnamed protein product [Brassica rapa]
MWGSLRSKRFPKIPRLHGKFRDVVRSLHSDARVELNSGGKTGSGNSGIEFMSVQFSTN